MKRIFLAMVIIHRLCSIGSAQVIVTPGNFPTMCQGGAYVTQTSSIVIAEQSVNGYTMSFNPNHFFCYAIAAPTNYQFRPGVGSVTFTAGGDVIAVHSYSFDITANYVLFYYECYSNTQFDTIKISGLQMRALTGAVSPENIIKMFGCDYMAGNALSDAQTHAVLTNTSNPSPIIDYTPESFYCNAESITYLLSGTPSGGVFSGSGVTGDYFNPFGLTIGNKVITYTVDNGGGCFKSSTINLNVKSSPTVSISSNDADNLICPGQSVTFTGSASGSNIRYQFLKNGLTVTTLSTTNTYSDNLLVNGDQIAVLADNGNATCKDTTALITISVVANPNPTISVTGLPALICSNNMNTYSISTSPVGGVLSGTGISGSTFSPSLAGGGTHVLNYTATSNGCDFPATASVTVVTAPTVTISSSDIDNIICDGDLVTFTATTGGTANRYLFLKNATGIQGPNATSTFTSTTLVDGDAISVTVDNGASTCQTTSSQISTTVGKIPNASYSWQSTCGLNEVTFHDLSSVTGGSTLVNWQWDYTNDNTFDHSQVAATPDPTFMYPTTNQYFSRLRVTSDKGCYKDTTIRVYTLPGKTPTPADPYAVNFVSSNQGWAYDGVNSSWDWGTGPADFGQGTRNFWSTGQNAPDSKYKTAEHSYLYGPCINLSQLDKPMLAIKLSSKIVGKPAGAILEVTTDDGLNWVKVGNIDEGLNWYNVTGIVSTPFTYLANSTNNNPLAQGWAEDIIFNNDNLSKIGLQQFAGSSSVRFRINFTSIANVAATRYSGIGIDSMWIGNRNKVALIEHFTNTGGPRTCCLNGDNAIDLINKKRTKDVTSIYYHTSFPEYDVLNLYNPGDPSSRILYYGTTAVAETVLDGTKYKGNIYSGGTAVARIDTNDVDAVVLNNAKFKIDLTTVMTLTNISTKVKLTYIDKPTTYKDIVLQVVVVEDTAEGNPINNNVCRKMLIDAAGTMFNASWTTGYSVYNTQSWNHNLPANAKLRVVVFAQDANTKEIYQAAFVKGSGTSGSVVVISNNERSVETQDFEVYPNPASDIVNISFDGILERTVQWKIIDNMGKIINEGTIQKGAFSCQINTESVKSNGVYYFKFFDGNTVQTKKVIVNK